MRSPPESTPMRLNTSSAEKRKQPSRLRNSVWVERGEQLADIVENARVRIEFFVLVLRKVIWLHVVTQTVLRRWSEVLFLPAT